VRQRFVPAAMLRTLLGKERRVKKILPGAGNPFHMEEGRKSGSLRMRITQLVKKRGGKEKSQNLLREKKGMKIGHSVFTSAIGGMKGYAMKFTFISKKGKGRKKECLRCPPLSPRASLKEKKKKRLVEFWRSRGGFERSPFSTAVVTEREGKKKLGGK